MKKSTVITTEQKHLQSVHYDRCAEGVKCPTCGKVPNGRTFDQVKRKWVYKHSSRRAGITRTVYHESVN